MDIESFLSSDELKIYKRILEELEKNKEYYLTADAVEKTQTLVENCGVSEKDIYSVIKKIDKYSVGGEVPDEEQTL